MTEGSDLPLCWGDIINKSDVERVIVPCAHNAEAFAKGGVQAPIHVIAGGTDPNEFPLCTCPRDVNKPYTFLALADRGHRKGWSEVYQAFYQAFGSKVSGNMDVRLIVKCRPDGNDLITDFMMTAEDLDKRLVFDTSDVADMNELYAQVDCFVIPSRSEGWGMPHREAAMTGLPVITQAYAGLEDAHEWAIVVEGGRMEPIPTFNDGSPAHIAGEWRVCDVGELAAEMDCAYMFQAATRKEAAKGAAWLRANQTWDHAAAKLIDLMKETGLWH